VAAPVIKSVPRPAAVKSAVTGVMPVNELFRPLVVEAPASVESAVVAVMPVDEFSRLPASEAPATAIVFGESHLGQRHTDDYRQGGNQQSEP